MNGRKFLSLLIASVAVLSLAFGSGAFTSVSAERGVSVSVVDDENAFVGYATSDRTVSDGDRVTLVTVTNRMPGELTVTNVDISAGSMSFSNVNQPTMGVGETGAIAGDVSCSAGSSEPVHVTVTVSGTGVWAKIFSDSDTKEREFEVTCEAPQANSINSVEFKGAGQVRINATPEGEIDLIYWTTTDGPSDEPLTFTKHGQMVHNTNDKLQETGEGGPKIVAVYFPATNTSYHHPQFDPENETIDSWGHGWNSSDSVDGNINLGA